MNKKLNKEDILSLLSSLKPKLEREFGLLSIGVFGSYSKNLQNSKSDIDILVDLKKEFKTFNNFMNIKFLLEEQTGKHIDLATQKALRSELKNEILKEVIYA